MSDDQVFRPSGAGWISCLSPSHGLRHGLNSSAPFGGWIGVPFSPLGFPVCFPPAVLPRPGGPKDFSPQRELWDSIHV
jgi:hypothetical protein